MENKRLSVKKIAIPFNEGYLFENITDLIYCESDENYSRLFFKCGKNVLTSKTLKELESILSGYNQFFRIHKKCLLNLNYISKYKKIDGSFVIELEDGTQIDVACRRRTEFMKLILKA